MSYGVGCRRGSDLALLWLWLRPAATALIRSLAWEPPYAVGAAPEKATRPKKKKIPFSFPQSSPGICPESCGMQVPGPEIKPVPQKLPKLLQ